MEGEEVRRKGEMERCGETLQSRKSESQRDGERI